MNYPRVAILMSTYNGEKYLDQQIISIINQTYENWNLYIRDDGSTDKTLDIIKRFQRKDKRIILYESNSNVGSTKSFMKLLNHTEADYYMFSDQDDYWLENKIKWSLEEMLKDNNRYPMCIYTNYKVVDKDLNTIMNSGFDYTSSDFLDILFTNSVTGCTMMINNSLKSLINFDTINYDNVYMHDWWIALIAAKFGRLMYINKATILYRQHGNNVVGSRKSSSVKRIFNRIFNLSYSIIELKRVINISFEFYSEYGRKLNGIDKMYLKRYGDLIKHSSFNHNLELVKNYPPRKKGILRKIYFEFLIIFFYYRL